MAPPSPRLRATAHRAQIGALGLRPRTFPAKRLPKAGAKAKLSRRSRALALSAVCWHEEPAVRALEAPVALGLAGHQFGRERLLAMGTDDLVDRLLGGHLGHLAKLPVLGEVEAVVLERCPLRWRRIAASGPEVDQAEEPFAVRQADRIAPRLRA